MMHVALVPRDGLFLKDGRGWYTSDVGRSYAHLWPLPHTVRGALRAAYGQAWMAEHAGRSLPPAEWEKLTRGLRIDKIVTLRRPVDAAGCADRGQRVWPVPQDAFHRRDGEVRALCPAPPSGVAALDHRAGGASEPADVAAARDRLGYPRLDEHGKPGTRPHFWSETALIGWLRAPGQPVPTDAGCSPAQRTDIHVTIDRYTATATPSMLFSCEVTETLERATGSSGYEWVIAVACRLPDTPEVCAVDARLQSRPLVLGGRRRMALLEPVDERVFAGPDDGFFEQIAGRRGLRLVCATPAHFARGWLPDGFSVRDETIAGTLPGTTVPVLLRAAMVPRPLQISSWNMVRRKPRATCRMVAPGAVYFVQRDRHIHSRRMPRSMACRIGP